LLGPFVLELVAGLVGAVVGAVVAAPVAGFTLVVAGLVVEGIGIPAGAVVVVGLTGSVTG